MLSETEKQKFRDFLKTIPYPVQKEYGAWALSVVESGNVEHCLNREGPRELYDAAGIIPEDHNIYKAFLDEIIRVHGIEGRHIIEVGGGALPRLAERIHLKQKNGSITVYDPRLFIGLPDKNNFRLKREIFKRNTPTHNADLLIGLMPCKGAEALVESAISNSIDFMVWLCEGGWHGETIDYFETDDEWRATVIQTARYGMKDKNMGKLMIKKLPEFSKEYPIIYNER